MIINQAALGAVFTNFRADYQAGMLAAKPLYDRIALTVPSATREEDYGWLGQYNGLREWIGDKHLKGLRVHGFSIVNRKFENTITVPRDDIEDDRVGVLSGAFKLMGQDAALHPDRLCFELLRDGATKPCYDGQYFFDTDHPVDPDDPAAGTVSNADLTAPGDRPSWILLDTAQVVKPVIFQKRRDYTFTRLDNDGDENVFMRGEYIYGVEARVNAGYGLWQLAYGSNKTFDATRYATARAAMQSLKAPSGNPLGISPTVALVAPSVEQAARQVLVAQNDAAGAGNVWAGTAEVIVCPWLG
ncbi:MAG: Mu-like prophage major head subunit gpT family protein [Rhodocyclaceae bacterium]|jgi:phage major head subunit gpT-like protein|nr:Mu-like prophage major head subunit gpT family protein [Rhodocyclaceae bacterium]